MIKKVEVDKFICNRCEHEWISKNINNNHNIYILPKSCPYCGCKSWNKNGYKKKRKHGFDKLYLSEQDIEKIKSKKK